MNTKNHILNVLQTELSKLISSYEDKIKGYEEQISLLTGKVNQLMTENDLLMEKVSLTSATSLTKEDNYFESHRNDQLYDRFKYGKAVELNLFKSDAEAVLMLEDCEQVWIDLETEKLTYIIATLENNQEVLIKGSEELTKHFLKLVKRVLIEENTKENEYDHLISRMFNIVIGMENAPFHIQVTDFLKLNNEKIFDNVLLRNDPIIITKYLRLLMVYSLKDEVKTALVHILDVEWGFIDSSLRKEDFIFLLWYTYLYDFDEDLIDRASISLQWFNESSNELKLYFYYFNEEDKVEKIYKNKVDQFKLGKVLTKYEKELVLQKMSSIMEPLLAKKPKAPIFNGKINVIASKHLSSMIKKHNLLKQKTTLPLYRNKNHSLISRYIETDNIFISSNRMRAFMVEEDLVKLNSLYSPLIIESRSYNGFIIDDNPVAKAVNDSFSWPSTELRQESKSNLELEEKILNEKSELILLGYQISGLTRTQRWEILEKAVPRIGLKKIALTISYNVKLRKGQKNGHQKFRYAISEWEHDLVKLKQRYYKKDFSWPKT